MSTIIKRVGKSGVSWQIDYFEPVPTEKQFTDESEANRAFDEDKKQDKRASLNRVPATVNREVACLRQMFRKAVVWDMVEHSPFDKLDPKDIRQPENNKKDRLLSREEIRGLLPECADHLKPIVETTLHAGLRMGEVLGLKWKHIDFKNERLFVEKDPDNKTKPGGWV